MAQRFRVGSLLFADGLLQGGGELVGARGALHAAGNALKLGGNVVGLHSLHHLGNAEGVARASANELNVVNALLIVKFKLDGLRASALGFKCVLLHD